MTRVDTARWQPMTARWPRADRCRANLCAAPAAWVRTYVYRGAGMPPHQRFIAYCDEHAARDSAAQALRCEQRRRGFKDVVYYASRAGLIKIGTSNNVARRMASLGADLLAMEEGTYQLETTRLRQFRHLRVDGPRREWFYPGDDLLEHIASVAAAITATGGVPAPSAVTVGCGVRDCRGFAGKSAVSTST